MDDEVVSLTMHHRCGTKDEAADEPALVTRR